MRSFRNFQFKISLLLIKLLRFYAKSWEIADDDGKIIGYVGRDGFWLDFNETDSSALNKKVSNQENK